MCVDLFTCDDEEQHVFYITIKEFTIFFIGYVLPARDVVSFILPGIGQKYVMVTADK